jgi:autotransporter passenger strand-loop-strand repeat protein
MTIFTVPANTLVDSNATFGPLMPGDLEQVFGSVINTTIVGTIFDTEQDIEAGGSADTTFIFGGEQQVFPGGFASNTNIFGSASGAVGEQQVDQGSTADLTTINAGGTQVVVGGFALNTTINQGGSQFLPLSDSGGGTAIGTTIDGGTQTINFGTAMSTTINSGEQDVGLFSGGQNIAENTMIIGGLQVVGPNGIADSTTIAGGTMHVMAGGVTEGLINFAGGGTLVIDQPVSGSTSFATPLVDVQAFVDTIDLTGLPFVTGATAVLSSSGLHQTLTVTSGNNSETFTLQNLDLSVTGFEVTQDLSGGTEVVAFHPLFVAKTLAPTLFLQAPALQASATPNGTSALVLAQPNAGSTVTLGNGPGSMAVVSGATSSTTSPLSNAIGDPSNTFNGADSGKDTFAFLGSFGPNAINNFITRDEGNHDTLELSRAEFGDLATMIKNGNIQQVGPDTLITNPLNPADTVKLTGISALELESHPSNFHFV